MSSSKLAILEKIARGEITVQQGNRFLTQIETLQRHCCSCLNRSDSFNLELDRTATIPTEELAQLVATKIAIRNGRQMRRIGPNLVES
ncbi:MAG: hypothetical protein ACXAEI_14010 [Candidatus Hodarchaeales archaeon]|jgi:hypothetical protein